MKEVLKWCFVIFPLTILWAPVVVFAFLMDLVNIFYGPMYESKWMVVRWLNVLHKIISI